MPSAPSWSRSGHYSWSSWRSCSAWSGLTQCWQSRTLAAYAAARKWLGAIQIEWKGGTLRPPDRPVRLDAAAGVDRFLLIEIRNSDEATMPFQVSLAGGRERAGRVIPSGQTRAYRLSFRVTDPGSQSVDMVVAAGGASGRIPVELRVARPAVLRGSVGEPARIYVESSDGVFRHGNAFRDVATVSEKCRNDHTHWPRGHAIPDIPE